MKPNHRRKDRLGPLVLSGVLTGLGVYANAGEFTLENNQLTITGSGASAGFSQTATVAANGSVTNIANVPTSSNVGIPTFSFTINANNVNAGTYSFRVSVVFDDDSNSSRLETMINTINLVVDGSGNITGSIPAQNLRLLGRTSSGSVEIQANISNGAVNGPVTISDGSVSFDGAALITKIKNSNSYFKDLILPEFDRNASYTYTIIVEQTGGAAQQFGIDSDSGAGYTFAAFPEAPSGTFILNSNELDSYYSASSQHVTGTFNVLVSSGGGDSGGTPSTETIEGASNATNRAAEAIDDVISGGGTPTQEQLNAVVTASQTLNTNLASTNANTVTTTQLSTLGSAVKKLVTTNQTLSGTSSASTSVTSNTNAVLSSAATLLKDFSEKETLSAEEAKAGLEIVKDLLTNAPGFFSGSDEDDKNLTSMSDLLAASFALGAKANPPVVFESKDYAGAVKALDNLNKKQDDASGVCGNPILASGLNVEPLVGSQLLSNLIWFGPDNPNPPRTSTVFEFTPLTLVPGFLQPFFGWYSNLDFNSEIFGVTVRVGPCGTITTSVSRGIQGSESNPMVLAATAPISIDKDIETNTIRANVGDETYIGSIFNALLVPSNFPDGTITQPNGTVLWIQEGMAYTIGSNAADFVQFGAAVKEAGFDVTGRSDGGFDIQTGPNETFSGVFAYDNVSGNEGACGTVTIAPPTGAVTSPDYAFTASCSSSGVTQRILPYVRTSDFYALGNALGLTVSTNRDTGVIHVDNVGEFKPSFFSHTLSAADEAFLNDNGTNGFAFRSADVNGDGKIDIEVLHSTGAQVLYGL